jgi:hypothetical protein
VASSQSTGVPASFAGEVERVGYRASNPSTKSLNINGQLPTPNPPHETLLRAFAPNPDTQTPQSAHPTRAWLIVTTSWVGPMAHTSSSPPQPSQTPRPKPRSPTLPTWTPRPTHPTPRPTPPPFPNKFIPTQPSPFAAAGSSSNSDRLLQPQYEVFPCLKQLIN